MKTVILAALTSILSAQSISFVPDIESEMDDQIMQVPDVMDEAEGKSESSPAIYTTYDTCETRKANGGAFSCLPVFAAWLT